VSIKFARGLRPRSLLLLLLEARRGKAFSDETSICVLFCNIQLGLKWRGHVPALSSSIVPPIDVSLCPKSNRTGSRIGVLCLLLKVHERVTTAKCNLAPVLKGIFNYIITVYELFRCSASLKEIVTHATVFTMYWAPNSNKLRGLSGQSSRYRTEMCCDSCEVRTEFIHVM
jgi:hypothetical protein